MTGNSIGMVFWLVALAAIVTAIGAVTLKKGAEVLVSLGLNVLAVTGLIWLLGFPGFSFLYLSMPAVGAAIAIFVFRNKRNLIPGNFQFERHSRSGGYFIISLLIFAGCLLLIANTDVWQYANEGGTKTFSELMSTLFDNYSLLMIFGGVFMALLVLVMLIKPKPGSN